MSANFSAKANIVADGLASICSPNADASDRRIFDTLYTRRRVSQQRPS